MPIDSQHEEHENDSDSDFCLDDDQLTNDHITDHIHKHNTTFRGSIYFPAPSATINLSQRQIDKIQSLMSMHFQMIIQLRHLTIDKLEFRDQHKICDDLLQDLREKKVCSL